MLLRAPAVYYTEDVDKDKACRERMDRMMTCITAGHVRKVNDEELNRIVLSSGWHVPRLKGEIRPYQEPAILFSTFRWHTEE